MGKYEVSLTPEYVKSWGVAEAIRELMQNALDAKTQGYPMSWEYDESEETLIIESKGAKLEASSLLLGATTKSNSATTVGQFGEGYKIAALSLLRSGLSLVITNGLTGEVWTPRFVKSRRYGCDVLTFFTEKSLFKRRGSLAFEVRGLSKEMFEDIRHVCLELDNKEHLVIATSPIGRVLEGNGDVYVGGLLVCNYEPYKYSYDFAPGTLVLDRDRKLASSFDLEWLASKMWASTNEKSIVLGLIAQGASDVRYLSHHISSGSLEMNLKAWQMFVKTYGSNAVPVSSQEEMYRLANSKYKPVLVNDIYKTFLDGSGKFSNLDLEEEEPISTRLRTWYDALKTPLTSSESSDFLELLAELADSGN